MRFSFQWPVSGAHFETTDYVQVYQKTENSGTNKIPKANSYFSSAESNFTLGVYDLVRDRRCITISPDGYPYQNGKPEHQHVNYGGSPSWRQGISIFSNSLDFMLNSENCSLESKS